MTANGPKAGLTYSRSLIVDPSVIVQALTPPAKPAHRHAAGASDDVSDGLRRGHPHRCPDAIPRGRWAPMSILAISRLRPCMRVTGSGGTRRGEGAQAALQGLVPGREITATGYHGRAVIDPAGFLARLEKKVAG